MIEIRHTGIYVNDIAGLEEFYKSIFDMKVICSMEPDSGRLFDELLETENAAVMTTKLITECGKIRGSGDMIELVKVTGEGVNPLSLPDNRPIIMTGMAHVAMGVADIKSTVSKILTEGGKQKTSVITMKNGNMCCFCTDPEGNWIELIQRKEDV